MGKTLNSAFIALGCVLVALGGFLFYQDSDQYNKALEYAEQTAQQKEVVPDTSSKTSDSKWGIFGGTKLVYKTDQANNIAKFAKEKYETERTKDYMIIGVGGVLAIAGIVLRKKQNV